ncbi:AraC family transcriptional regulator [Cohnella luojiensis]|uniref:AraC family transcriptional regulator n=1 Tax=Cohnella luojiensis TaxID=652876 RepID=A0A4Y8LVS8_9BACL|nr:AraC family transcriptional regulator [Cohnella luojiensis]TFE23333.1 AraC family transcriptional regulator [Cohnella luojiensis]
MKGYEFLVDTPIKLELTGKFKAPTSEWMHLSRYLMDYELIVLTSGTLYIAGDKHRYTVNVGEYLLLPPLTNQYGYKSSDCSFYWLHFSYKNDITVRDNSNDSSAYEVGKIVIPQQGTLKSVERIIVMMKQLQDSVRGYNEKTLNDYMSTVILCEVYNQLFFSQNNPNKKSKQEQLYNDIVDHIRWRHYENTKVSQIADHFGYNEKYLSHLFTKLSGLSLKQYILHQKMEVAKSILSDTNHSVSEIAFQLGYKDCHNFMKSFKKIVGLTPSEFRNAYSKRLLYYE